MAYYVREEDSNATFYAVLAAGLIVLVGFMIFAFTQLTTSNNAVTDPAATNETLLPETQIIEVLPPAQSTTHNVEIMPAPASEPATTTTDIDITAPADNAPVDNMTGSGEEVAR